MNYSAFEDRKRRTAADSSYFCAALVSMDKADEMGKIPQKYYPGLGGSKFVTPRLARAPLACS